MYLIWQLYELVCVPSFSKCTLSCQWNSDAIQHQTHLRQSFFTSLMDIVFHTLTMNPRLPIIFCFSTFTPITSSNSTTSYTEEQSSEWYTHLAIYIYRNKLSWKLSEKKTLFQGHQRDQVCSANYFWAHKQSAGCPDYPQNQASVSHYINLVIWL